MISLDTKEIISLDISNVSNNVGFDTPQFPTLRRNRISSLPQNEHTLRSSQHTLLKTVSSLLQCALLWWPKASVTPLNRTRYTNALRGNSFCIFRAAHHEDNEGWWNCQCRILSALSMSQRTTWALVFSISSQYCNERIIAWQNCFIVWHISLMY